MGLLVANVGPVKKPGGVKRFVGRVARKVAPRAQVVEQATRGRICKNYQQLHQSGQPLDVGLLARRVDQITESLVTRTNFDKGELVVASAMVSCVSLLVVSVSLNLDLYSAQTFLGVLGGVLVSTPALYCLLIKVEDVSDIVVQHSVKNLMSLITHSQQQGELAYVRGVINEPGHEDIKKQVLDELVLRYSGEMSVNESYARALIVFYDLLSDSQKQRLLQYELTLPTREQSPAKLFSIHQMLLENPNYNLDGLEVVCQQNVTDFLKSLTITTE